MTKQEFITERTRIISEMLDNPNEYGIYPTTKCFEQLDELFDKIESNQFIVEIAEMLNIETDGLGYDGLQLSLDDFQKAINRLRA